MKNYYLFWIASCCLLYNVVFATSGPIDICSQGNQVLTAPVKANATYQWQMITDSTASYFILGDNATFSGVNGHTLTISNLSTGFYGRAIRCRIVDPVTGLSYSDTVFFRFKNTWNGSISNAWENPSNWSCGQVPDAHTDIIINSGTPVVSSHVVCRSLTVGNGANVTVGKGFSIQLTHESSRDVVLHSNVRVIDSTLFTLNLDSAKLENGTYEFTIGSIPLPVLANDVIVGYADVPFARKVKSVQVLGNKVTLETEPAGLGDIFQKLSMHQSFNSAGEVMQGLQDEPGNPELQDDDPKELKHIFNNLSIISNASASITATGDLSASGDWDFDLEIKDSQVDYLFMGAKTLNFNAGVSFNFQTNGTYNLPSASYSTPLFKVFRIFPIYAGIFVIPVYMEIIASLQAEVGLKAEAALARQVTLNHESALKLGVEYSNGSWRTIAETNMNSTLDYSSQTELAFEAEGSIGPVFSLKFYKLAGPYIAFPVTGELSRRATQVSGEPMLWDFNARAHLDFKAGVNAGFSAGPFEATFFDFFYSKKFLTKEYTTPFELQKVTTGNPVAEAGQYLDEPIKVKVLDQKGIPEQGVAVLFEVMEGGGFVNLPYAHTNGEGIASVNWSLGVTPGTPQKLKATVLRSDRSSIQSSPQVFEAFIKAKPVVTTNYMHSVSANFAQVNSTLHSAGGSPLLVRGVCWNTTGNPTVFNSKTSDGKATGSYFSFVGQLTHQTTYYVRAYAINQTDTAYGATLSFTTTPPLPLILTVTSNGAVATASTQHGVPPYKYSWNGGPLSDNNTFNDVSVRRNITLKVVDAVGAELTRSDICVGAWGNFVPSPCTVQQFRYYLNEILVCTLSLNQTQNAIFVGSHNIKMVGVYTGATHNGSSTIQPGQACIQWFTCCPNANTCSPNLCN